MPFLLCCTIWAGLFGLPRWLSSEESTCNTGYARDVGSIPESGRSSAVGNDNPFQYSCLESSIDRGA